MVSKEKNIEIIKCGEKRVGLKGLMEELGKRGISSVLIEGGAGISTSALKEGIIDKFYFFIATEITFIYPNRKIFFL